MRPEPLEVGDEMLCGVVGDLAAGRRAPGAALVEQHDAPERGIEVAAMVRQAAAARAAVQEDERHAGRVPAGFPVQRVPRVDGKPAGRVGVDLGKENFAAKLRVVRHVG